MNIPAPVVEIVPLNQLVPWNRNPRKEHAVARIAASIQAFGYAAPIIVQKTTYRILAGHGRAEALRTLGAEMVPVIVLDVDDDRADLYTLADNKLTELAEWDFGTLAELLLDFDHRNLDTQLTGFSDDEMTKIMNWTQGTNGEGGTNLVEQEQFGIVVKCRSEREQVELLVRLQAEGLEARAIA